MVNLISTTGIFEPFSKLICIRIITISFYTGVKLITGKTITVGHRVTKRNIVDFALFFVTFMMLVLIEFSSANRRSYYAKEHKQRHENRKSFDFLVSKIHFCSFPSLKLDSV